ncbi:MAG: hypothetical protein M1828_004975 [Chrysothrix sp. TS-e1954]|nr:MAG: hypothetical protein M1828_004975 [Chrysothrix sp. TS-e1954]
MERLKLLMNDDEWPVPSPGHTDDTLRAAAPNGSQPSKPDEDQGQELDREDTSADEANPTAISSTNLATYIPKRKGRQTKQTTVSTNETSTDSAGQLDNTTMHGHAHVRHPDCGKLASPNEAFCPIFAVSKYPYKFVEKSLSQPIATAAFDDGKFWRREWDVYYLWPEGISETKPLLLVPALQVEKLLTEINTLVPAANVTLGSEAETFGLVVRFAGNAKLRPRFLGQSGSREKFASLEKHVPSVDTSYEGSPTSKVSPLTDDAVQDWRRKMDLASEVSKGKKLAAKAAKKQTREEKQTHWKSDLKTAERFLGMRPLTLEHLDIPENASWHAGSAAQAVNDLNMRPMAIDPEKPPAHPFYKYPVLISLDIECYEHDKSKITEIGLATLDTLTLTDAPGVLAQHWRTKARGRHFRIREHLHLNNNDFVSGCADKFEFGESELVDLVDAPATIATCFRPPFSAPETYTPRLPNGDIVAQDVQRHLVLVGHDILNDIRYLRILGYDISNLSSHLSILDTADLHRVYSQAWNPKSLAGIMYEFEIPAFNLHNAGNDAMYTLWVMLALVVRSASERGTKEKKIRLEEMRMERVKEHMAREAERVMQDNTGWDTDTSL